MRNVLHSFKFSDFFTSLCLIRRKNIVFCPTTINNYNFTDYSQIIEKLGCGWGERLSVCDHLDVISNVLGALTTVEHSMPLVQYAACHKSYPFQEKFPAIVIRNSSIISRFVSIGLHAGIQEFSSGGASRFICH